MHQIQTKHLLPIVVLSTLLLSLSIPNSLGVSPPRTVSLFSEGEINYEESTLWWGVCTSDPGWEPYGSFFDQDLINLLKSVGANEVRLELDKAGWDADASTKQGFAYREYIKQIVEWCHPEIHVLIDLEIDSSYDNWSSEQKVEIMKTPTLRQDWLNWGMEIISYCSPDAILVMDEPATESYVGSDTGQITEDEYREFLIECIEAWREVSDIPIHVYGAPFKYLRMFNDNPLPYDDIVYHLNYPYYGENSPSWGGWAVSYWNGDLETAKSQLYAMLNGDDKAGWLLENGYQVMITVGTEYDWLPNWQACMKDAYDWAKANGVWLDQWAMAKGTRWNLLETTYDVTSEIGSFWVQNVL